MSTKPKRKRKSARSTSPATWPFDLNRPWLRDPKGTPYAVSTDPSADALIEQWREILSVRDDLIARVMGGDTRAASEVSALDRQLATYPSRRRFNAVVRQCNAAKIAAAVDALVWVLKQVHGGPLGRQRASAAQDDDVQHAATTCRVGANEVVRVAFHRDTKEMFHEKGVVRAAVIVLEAFGTFGSEATIFRRLREHRTRVEAETALGHDPAITNDEF